jgi:Protein of unknown function (DUF2442)
VAVNAGFASHEIGGIIRIYDRIAMNCWVHGMSTLEIEVGDLRARSVEFTPTELVVTLMDGRRIATPLDWYPRLVKASAAQRANYEIMAMGIHWPDIDEDLGIAGITVQRKVFHAPPLLRRPRHRVRSRQTPGVRRLVR